MIRPAVRRLLARLPLPRRRRVHYARDLAALPLGTLLTFDRSSYAAVRIGSGWVVTGREGTNRTDDVIRNLPARIVRRGVGEGVR